MLSKVTLIIKKHLYLLILFENAYPYKISIVI